MRRGALLVVSVFLSACFRVGSFSPDAIFTCASDADGCSGCVPASCGDGGIRANFELCDDKNTNNSDACTIACTLPSCGDTIVQAGEQCDDGNNVDSDGCLSTCLSPACGDGIVHAGEACDNGNVSAQTRASPVS